MRIWFHGTNKDAADNILKKGFRPGTWFAAHLEDALAFGGPYVFEVALYRDKEEWQIQMPGPIAPDCITALTRFDKEVLHLNMIFKKQVYETNSDGSIDGFADKVEEHRYSNEN